MLGYFTGCPAGGILKTGGTPLEIAAVLDAYAKLISAFNGSESGKKILEEVARNIANRNPGLFIQQSVQLSQDSGSQLAVLATLGNSADSAAIKQMAGNALAGNNQAINGALGKVIGLLRDKLTKCSGAECAVAAANLRNAQTILTAAPAAINKALLDPFKNANNQLVTSEGEPVTAEYITHAVISIARDNQEYQPAETSDE